MRISDWSSDVCSSDLLEPGKQTAGELMADVKRGIYVTELIGMGVNPVTGDYSRGASGFLIENGATGPAVAEITIAGNLLDMLLELPGLDNWDFLKGKMFRSFVFTGRRLRGGGSVVGRGGDGVGS